MAGLLDYAFFRYALLGGLLASILCAMIGTYIVTRRLVFISGGITHASFGGIGIGMFTGLSPLFMAAIFAVSSACGVQWLSHKRNMREDSAIAIFWTLGMSLGIIFSFLTPGYATDLSSFLFGNILTISPADLIGLAILTAVTLLVFTLLLHPIVAVAFDESFARSQRLPVTFLEHLLMILIALTIVACLRMVGIVLVISLLTIPQVTANLFTCNFRTMILLSAAIGYTGCLGGLSLSFLYNVPSGASIILVSIVIYIICKACRALFISRRRQ